MEIPDSIEPLLGYRTWRIKDGELYATTRRRLPWLPGLNRAVCRIGRLSDKSRAHASPAPECSCGLYACHRPKGVFRWSPEMLGGGVVGAVAMWGNAEVHYHGIRSQYARPLLLAAPPWRVMLLDRNFLLVAGFWLLAACAWLASVSMGAKALFTLVSCGWAIGYASWLMGRAVRQHWLARGKSLQELAERYGCRVVKYQELEQQALQFGSSIPQHLLPDEPKRWRFSLR